MPPIIVYEDPGWQRLLPLVYVRAVFQLVCGTMDLLSRVRVHAPSEPDLWCRPNLADLVGEQTSLVVNRDAGAATLFLNGRGLWTGIPDVSDSDGSWVGTCGSDDIACIYADSDLVTRLSAEDLLDETRLRGLLSGLPRRDVGATVRLMMWPWDFVLANEAQLEADWVSDPRPGVHGRVCEGAYLLGKENVFIGKEHSRQADRCRGR